MQYSLIMRWKKKKLRGCYKQQLVWQQLLSLQKQFSSNTGKNSMKLYRNLQYYYFTLQLLTLVAFLVKDHILVESYYFILHFKITGRKALSWVCQ